MTDAPILLIALGDDDPSFRYATGFGVEQGLYLRHADGDDVLAVSLLELGRAQAQARVARVVDRADWGWRDGVEPAANWARVASRLLQDRQITRVRVAPDLGAAAYLALRDALASRDAGIEVEIVSDLLVPERRQKSDAEVSQIARAQAAAEAALVAVVHDLREATPGEDGRLWQGASPLTSERLLVRCQGVLLEHGCANLQAIIAGSPECAMPHFRGAGPIRAGAPVIIDIFPGDLLTGYHGDLTRTVVVGPIPPQIAAMHQACLDAMVAAYAVLGGGADGRDVHRAACAALVDAGFGSATEGLEGTPGAPRMIHSTGHGVGLEVHEAPALRDAHYPLLAGDVVSVEPGLYLDGLGGVRVEDLVVVTDGGYRNLTHLPTGLDPAGY
ncbi:MAG: Xaa-Pro peptidase family protein [Candidatus Dormiibacterota bacterium]